MKFVLVMNKLKRFLQNISIPKVNNFKEAEEFCNLKTTNGYQSKILCEYRFNKLDNYLKNGGSLLNVSSVKMLMFCVSHFLYSNKGMHPKIIDFGGACGENILLLESIIGKKFKKDSFVLESLAQTLESQNWTFAKNINFSNDLINILKNEIDIFFTSCALNYINDPYDVLSKVAKKKVPLICLTRNNFSESPSAFIQVSNLSENGFGKHIGRFGNPLIWYPSQTLSEKIIKDIFLNANYELIFDDCINNTGITNKRDNYSRDYIFKLKF